MPIEAITTTFNNWGITEDVLLFTFLQLINVVIATVRSVLTVNGSKLTASVSNALSYTFGAVLTKMLVEQSFEVIIAVTLLTNMIGVWFGRWILDKTRKERLWTITATLRGATQDKIEQQLLNRGVQYTLLPAKNDRALITIFSTSKGESSLIQEILEESKIPFTITENRDAF